MNMQMHFALGFEAPQTILGAWFGRLNQDHVLILARVKYSTYKPPFPTPPPPHPRPKHSKEAHLTV